MSKPVLFLNFKSKSSYATVASFPISIYPTSTPCSCLSVISIPFTFYLVEINAIFAEAIAQMKGLETDIAHNGEEAVKMLEASGDNYYSIVFMDIQMPVMNGYEASKRIRASKRKYLKTIPIIAMSANAYEEDRLTSRY